MIRTVRPGWRCLAAVAATSTIAGVALYGAPSATAATSTSGTPTHAVGNYLDAMLGGQPIDAIAKLAYADATDPGSTSTQNPLDVTLLKQLNLPLTGALQLPSLAGISLGAVTQKAQAKTGGKSFGQAGTALNQGGVSIGASDSSDKAGEATIDLSAKSLAGNSPIPIPGADAADALGGVQLHVGAVSAVAQAPHTTGYNIASLGLSVGSPALGALLKGLGDALDPSSLVSALGAAANSLPVTFPEQCSLKAQVLSDLSLEDGAITISPTNGSLQIDLKALLHELGLNLNALPPNTDVIAYLLSYLADPNGLSRGLENAITDLVNPLEKQFNNCLAALHAVPGVGTVADLVSTLETQLTSGQNQLEAAVNGLVGQLSGLAGGTGNPLKPLSDALGKLIDIGVNVQENGPAGPSQAAFVSGLDATAKQGTDVEPGTTLVRALEINVAAGAGASLPALPSLPGLNGMGQGLHAAAPQNAGILTLALANASVRQGSAAPAAPPTAVAASPGPGTLSPAGEPVPTAVSAGQGTHGTPVTPLILLALGMGMAGAAGITWKVRGKHA